MKRIERLELAKKLGYTCNYDTGEVFGLNGKVLKSHKDGYLFIRLNDNGKIYHIYQHNFIWYMYHGYDEEKLMHIDGDLLNNKINNLRKFQPNGYHLQRGRWICQFRFNGKQVYVGSFDTKYQARDAYLEYLRTH